MQNIVYVDLLIIINAIISYFLLKLCTCFTQQNPGVFRLCAASFAAGFSSVSLFLPFNNFIMLVIKIACAAIIVLICFSFKNIRVFIKMLIIYIMCNIALAGVVFLLVSLGAKNISYDNFNFYINVSPVLLIACILIMYISLQIFSFVFGKIAPKQRVGFSFEIDDKIIKGTALIDTGMNIKDVMTGKNIALCSFISLKNQLPSQTKVALNNYFINQNLTVGLWLISVKTANGLCMLPALSVKKLNLFNMQIVTKQQCFSETVLVFTNEIITDDAVQMLINPDNI